MNGNKKTRLLALLSVITIASGGIDIASAEQETPVAVADETPLQIAVQANSRFAFDLYARLAEEHKNQNLFFSPYSLSNCLLMAAEGARNKTAAEMGTVLGLPDALRREDGDAQQLPWEMDRMHAGHAELHRLYNHEPVAAGPGNDERKKGKAPELRVANAVWGDKGHPFAKPWLTTIDGAYGTGAAQEADFQGQPEQERIRINAWVAEKTNQHIKDLLPANSVDPSTRLVLTNAVYFNAAWLSRFESGNTSDEYFQLGIRDRVLPTFQKVKVPLMYHHGMRQARYGAFNADGSFFDTPVGLLPRGAKPRTYPDADGFAMVELPYKGGGFSMIVLAPNRPDGLPALEAGLDCASMEKWISDLKRREVNVALPKFKFETSYQLNDTLKTMGMTSAFTDPADPRGADFSGMTTGPNSDDRLSIGLVVHKGFINVNEEGTQAAAASATAMLLGAAFGGEEPFVPSFRADRPFLYLIRDKQNGAILFLGRVLDPRG